MITSLLIDADIVAFKFAAAAQQPNPFDPEGEPIVEDADSVFEQVKEYLEDIKKQLSATSIIICLSDKKNFRKDVLPTYKMNRSGLAKPILLNKMKDMMEEFYPSYRRPSLEADDIMGILATHKSIIPQRKIIVSEDKDMQQIPGWLFNPRKDTEPRQISEAEADLYHLFQTLTGDAVDGYSGCPSIGKVRAEKILSEEASWDAVLYTYLCKGLTEEDALQQARVARICRATDYDFDKKEPILWKP